MGPHPETPVDVQKYIGSCLITQQPRSKRKSCPRGGQLLPKDGSGRCNGYGPKMSGFSSMTNYAWTGVPLISVARQQSKSHPGKSRGKPGKDYPRVESPVDSCNLEELLPISRLAIHAQGAPLILSPKDTDKNSKDIIEGYGIPYKGHDFYLGEGSSRLYMLMPGCPDDVMTPHSMRGEQAIMEDDVEAAQSRAVSSSPSQSDCISTTSEDSGTSENGLPRIIKPRKRRKKDRRLSESDVSSSVGGGECGSSIVTLKPYQPLCYRYGGGGGYKVFSSSKSPKSSSGDDESPGLRKGVYPYPPSSRCRCPHCVPPPSTLLTPPDSPVGEDSVLAIAGRQGGRFLAHVSESPNGNLDETALKSQSAVVRKYLLPSVFIPGLFMYSW